MGCCMSTNTTSPPPPKAPHIPNSEQDNGGSKSPPPTYPFLEEETVKQVLYETTTIPKYPSPPEKKHHQNGLVFKKFFPLSGSDELSEVNSAEICTHSENVSASTGKRGGNGEFHDPASFKNLSLSGDLKSEKVDVRSPNRGRLSAGPGYGWRTDGGESSGRRSKSPVIRPDSASSKTVHSVRGTKSSRKTDKSWAPVRADQKVEKEKESEEICMWAPTTRNELLENPHMSLECFIFL